MKHLLLLSLFCPLELSASSAKGDNEFDLIIYGGTSAGITAAVHAAKLGRTVALVEPGRHFGGMSVEGLGSTDIDNHAGFKNSPAVGGLAREFYERIARAYGKPGPQWKFEPSVAEKVFADWLAEHRDPYRVPGDPASGVIHTVQDEPLGEPGAGDARIQAYCFRLCFTRDPANRIPFAQPTGYDPTRYEIYRRYVRAGGALWRPGANLPNGKTDMGSWHDLSANLYGMNHAYPGGDYATRARVLREHLQFTQGLCWFLANDPALPASLREAWSQWGACKDEFTDNGGWPRQFYVRDARRMVNDNVITEHHTRKRNPARVDDAVAMAFWPPDTHSVRRIVRDGAAYNEGFVFGGDDWAPFGVSYRALVPRSSECENLLTPTCPASSHVAYGAIRIEWTFMALGQAVAAAAAQAIDRGLPVQAVDVRDLVATLRGQGQVTQLPQ